MTSLKKNIELKSDVHNLTHEIRLTEYFQNFYDRCKSQINDTNESIFTGSKNENKVTKGLSKLINKLIKRFTEAGRKYF